MTLFDTYLVVDWSARSTPSPSCPSPDSIWVGKQTATGENSQTYIRTRFECFTFLHTLLCKEVHTQKRILLGFDFAFGYPQGLSQVLRLRKPIPPWQQIWDEITQLIIDAPNNANNRFAVANSLNQRCHGNVPGPFWGLPPGKQMPYLNPKSPRYPYQLEKGQELQRFRLTERILTGVRPTWQLSGAGSVGGQTLTGIPTVARLREDPDLVRCCQVWPFETAFSQALYPTDGPWILMVEIWPGVVPQAQRTKDSIKDRAQVRDLARWLSELDKQNILEQLLSKPKALIEQATRVCLEEEGWILGSGMPLEHTLATG